MEERERQATAFESLAPLNAVEVRGLGSGILFRGLIPQAAIFFHKLRDGLSDHSENSHFSDTLTTGSKFRNEPKFRVGHQRAAPLKPSKLTHPEGQIVWWTMPGS